MESTFDIFMNAVTIASVLGLGGLGLVALPWSDDEVALSGHAFKALGGAIISAVHMPLHIMGGSGEAVSVGTGEQHGVVAA